MESLTSRFLKEVPSPDGLQAELLLVEPNGDEHHVRCLARQQGTDIFGDGEMLGYLNGRYGDREVCLVARDAVIRHLGN